MKTAISRCADIAAQSLCFGSAWQRITFLLVVMMICATADAVVLHPSHVSLAEVEFNPKTNSLEVSLCVWPEDVAHVINRLNGEPVDLDDQTLQRLLPDYLEDKFVVQAVGTTGDKLRPLSIRWVGAEIDPKKVWLYFEVKSAESELGWEIDNKIFCELNEDQVNHISFRVRSPRRSIPIQRFQCNPDSKANRVHRKPPQTR